MRRSCQSDSDQSSGIVFNIMRFALNDGPGIRTTVFLKGCPLSCAWCHNPESQDPKPEVMFEPERCIACGDCVEICDQQALRWEDGKPVRDPEKCELCGKCFDACPSEARRLVGYRLTAGELLHKLLRDRMIFEESGGGVTFSGGEPLAQPEFLSRMLQSCRSEGLHTVIDTCGHAPAKTFSSVTELTDMLLFDLKLISPERHRQATGVDNSLILENLRWAATKCRRLVVRIPVVPGINSDPENINATLRILQSVGVQNVDLLPYHKTGMEKYRRIGLGVPAEFVSPTGSEMKTLCEEFSARGFTVRIGG